MMHTVYGAHPAGSMPAFYSQDIMFDEAPRQMSVSHSTRRTSPSSTGQRLSNASRVTKPTSANTSPRSSIAARRRTLMNDDNAQRRRQQALEQASITLGASNAQPSQRSARPLSWHPGSYAQQYQTPVAQSCYPLCTPNMYADQHDVYMNQPHMSPMTASYSCNTSPTSFSPLSLPFQATDATQYFTTDNAGLSLYPSAKYDQVASDFYTTPAPATENEGFSEGWDWNAYVMHGSGTTSPPTPEAFPQPQLAQPVVSEEQIPCQALDEPEEEGEILVGMGLYDTPEKVEDDPQLNNYRSTVSSLLGSSFRSYEPRGKGLKLEETWEPPKSDDEDEQDGSEDESDDDAQN